MKIYHLEETELAKQIQKEHKKGKQKSGNWRKETVESFDYVAGHQWSYEDEAKLTEEKRPYITFNRCNVIISAVLGMEANQRQEVSYTPAEKGDSPLAETIDQVTEWVERYGEIEFEDTQAFEDMVTCGMGWTETRMDYEKDLDGKIQRDNFSPLEGYWDPNARKRNLQDAAWVCRAKKFTLEEVKERWPKLDLRIVEGIYDDDEGENPHENDPNNTYDPEKIQVDVEDKNKNPLVLQFQWYETVPAYRVVSPMTGMLKEIDEEKYNKLKDIPEFQRLKTLRQMKRKYYQAFVIGDSVAEKSELSSQAGFTLKCMTGKRDHIQKCWYGLLRLMKDPQKWANKFFSSMVDIVDANSKGGVLAEIGAISNPREFEEKWAKADSILYVNDGALTNKRIQPKPVAPYPVALDPLLKFSVACVYDATGVNLELLGMVDRGEVGMVVESRKRSAYTILAPFFDSYRFYRKDTGLLLLEFVVKYLPVDRIAQALEKELQPFAPMVKQIDLQQINVVVTESPQSDNNKLIAWAFIQQVVPVLLKSGVSVPPEILDYSPLPATLTEKWKKMLEGDPAQKQMQMQMMVKKALLEIQKEEADIQKTVSSSRLTDAQTVQTGAETQKTIMETKQAGVETAIMAMEGPEDKSKDKKGGKNGSK